MKKVLTIKEYGRMSANYDKVKHLCKCGHRVIIPIQRKKTLCSWCGNYVFRDKRDEFKYRVGGIK